MTTIIILNIVFVALVVVGILALLGWGIGADRALATSLIGAQPTMRAPRFSPIRRRRARLAARIA